MILKNLIFNTPRSFLRAFAAAALTLAFAAGLTVAKEKDGKHLDGLVTKMEKELKLTKDQTTKIRAILAKDSGTMPHRGEWKKGKGCAGCDRCGEGKGPRGGHGLGSGMTGLGGSEFLTQLRAGSVDTAAMNRAFAARSDSMQAKMRAGHARRVATFAEIHAVLTPEQRAQAAAKLEKFAAERDKKCEKKCGKDCKK
jgi:Spy/CpxP family protein refolding chaperone